MRARPTSGAGIPGRVRAAASGALFLLALGACVLVLLRSPSPPLSGDQGEYLALARSIAAGHGFTLDGITPAVYRPPLFPGLLGLWFALTGDASTLSMAWLQSLLHASGVVCAFLLFCELCPALPQAAGWAAFLAVSPILVTRVVFVLAEPTLLLTATLACLASVRLLDRPSPRRAALAGAAWGLCILGKSVCWFAPLLLLATRALPAPRGWSWRRKEALALLICCGAVVLPWTARNYLRFGRLIAVNGQGQGLLEWKVRYADIAGEPPGAEVLDAISREHPGGPDRTAALWRWIAAHPRYFLVSQPLESALHYAALPRDWWIHVGGRRPHVRDAEYWLLFGVCYVPFYLALLVRSWRLVRAPAPPGPTFLALLLWAYWAEHALLWGDARYNLALYPVLVAMALPLGRGGGAAGVVPLQRRG